MKSSVRTSTIELRMITKYWPSSISVIAVAGSTRCSPTSSTRSSPVRSDPGVSCSPAGKIGIATANSRIRMSPIQYSGVAYVNRLKPSSPSSVLVPLRVAATMPSHVPMTVASSVPAPTSSSVHGSASPISVHTDRRVFWLIPRSPCAVSET